MVGVVGFRPPSWSAKVKLSLVWALAREGDSIGTATKDALGAAIRKGLASVFT
jgi:hypothetical protein